MSDPSRPIDPPLTRDERKQLLVLACQIDRVAWCDSCRPRPRPPTALVVGLLGFLEPLASLIPGLPGRWLRKMGFFARLARQFGFIAS